MSALFETLLQEDKTSHIKKLKNLSDEEKSNLIVFFKTHSNLENKIDWNNKNLTIEDFKPLLQTTEKSRSNKKKVVKQNLSKMFDNKYCRVWYHDSNIIFVSPLDHECAVFMDSFDCYGLGAQWCIGTKDQPEYWKTYTRKRKKVFLMYYNKQENYKVMLEYNRKDGTVNLWDQNDTTEFTDLPAESLNKILLPQIKKYGNSDLPNFEEYFKDLSQYAINNFDKKADPQIAALLGDPNYNQNPLGEGLEEVVRKMWYECDQIEKNYGGRYDIKFNSDKKFFTFVTDQPTIVLNTLATNLDETFPGTPIARAMSFQYSYYDIYYNELQNLDDLPLTGPERTNPVIQTIECPHVIIYCLDNLDTGINFPPEIKGDLEFRACDMSREELIEGLPKTVSGKITFTNCKIPSHWLRKYQAVQTNGNLIAAANLDTELPQQYLDMLDNYYNGKGKGNVTEDVCCEKQVLREFLDIYGTQLKVQRNVYNKPRHEAERIAFQDTVDKLVKEFAEPFIDRIKNKVPDIDLSVIDQHLQSLITKTAKDNFEDYL